MKNRKVSLLLVLSVFSGIFQAITTPYAAHAVSGSIYLNDAALSTAYASEIDIDTGQFTMEMWIKPTADVPQGLYTGGQNGGQLGYKDSTCTGSTAKLFEGTWGERCGATSLLNQVPILNKWNHIVFERDGANLESVYLNGERVLSTAGVHKLGMNNSYGTFNIGAVERAKFTGYISSFRLTTGAALYSPGMQLPSSELTSTTASGTVVLLMNFATNNELTDSISNRVFTTTGTKKNSVAEANTSNTYAFTNSMPSFTLADGSVELDRAKENYLSTAVTAAGTDSVTYEWWFRTTNDTTNQGMLQTRTSGTGCDGFDISLQGKTIIVGRCSWLFTSGNIISINTWYHIAAVRNGAQAWKIYLNGAEIGSFNDNVSYTSTGLLIGRKSSKTETFSGNISNFRYVKGTALYTSDFSASLPTSALTAVSGTNLLLNTLSGDSSNFLKDSSGNNRIVTNSSTLNLYAASSSLAPFLAKKASTTTISCPSPQTYTGLAITPCTATVTGDGGLNETTTVTYGNNISVGTATVTASFAANASYLASSASTTFTISKRATSIAFTCTANQVYTGSALTPCSATLTGSGGLVETATVTYGSNTNAGTATISASYAGAATYEASSGSGTFVIAKAPSSIVTTCSNQTYNGGALAPCTATVTGVGGLSETITPTYSSNTDAGTASVTALFAGDSNHDASTSVTTFAIGQAGSTTSFTASTTALILGESVTLTAAVTSGATGVVTFKDAALNSLCVTANLSAGSASCAWTPGSVATFAVSAFYLGDNNFTASNSVGSNIVVTPVTHIVTYNANGGTSVLDSATVLNGNTLVLTTASRYGYHFDGWFTSQNGGTQVSSPYAATSSSTIWARWTQSSLYGLTSAELGTPDSVESDLSRTKIISTEFGSTSSTIRIPAGAFLNPTTVDVYTLADNAFAEGRIPDSNVYIISQVVAWRESNGTIPIARSAVQMTITSPSIKVGAIVYSIVDGVVKTTDTATVAGSITIFMTEDPIIVVAEAPVTPPCNCQQQNQNIVVRDPAPVVVEPKKEVVEEAKEEIVVEPKEEIVLEPKKEVVEVSVPTPKINRVYKSQLKIYFDLGSATVNSKSLKAISVFVGKLSKNQHRMKITAVGFTQPTLINPYPEALSRARAKSVIQIVKRYGLPAKYQFIGKGNALTNSDKSRYVNLTITRTEAANA